LAFLGPESGRAISVSRGRRAAAKAAPGLEEVDPVTVLARFTFAGRIRRKAGVVELLDAVTRAISCGTFSENILRKSWPSSGRHRL
jgi:hypothetical protein